MANINCKRITWLDYGRGMCMLIVVIYHIMCIYLQDTRYDYIFTPFFLNTFFFISGYLTPNGRPNWNKELISIFNKLVIPYLIFTSLIWIPKALFYANDLSITSYLIDIMGGYASWFIAALIVAKFILIVLRQICCSMTTLIILGITLTSVGILITSQISENLPWFINYALISLFYIIMGYIYKREERNLRLDSVNTLCLIIAIYVILLLMQDTLNLKKIYIYDIASFSLSKTVLYFPISIVGVFLAINISKILSSNMKWLMFIGQNSLVYYFLNGAVITIFTFLFNKAHINFTGDFVLMFAITICILTLCTLFINRFFPWMIGNRLHKD